MGNSESSPVALSMQEEKRLFEAEAANRAVQVAEVTVLSDEEKQHRIDEPFVPTDTQAAAKSVMQAQLVRSVQVRFVKDLADQEKLERIAADLHLDAMSELVRTINARRVDLDAEHELSRRTARWFIAVPECTSDAIASINAELLRKSSTARTIELAEQEKARRVEMDLRLNVHEELERYHARSGAALAIALEHLRRKSAPLFLREKSLQEAMSTVMTDVVRKCGVRLVKKQADNERVERVAADLKMDAQEAIIRRYAISTAMMQEEMELSRRCATWFHKFPEDTAMAKNEVQEDLRRCFQKWVVTKEAQAEQQHRVAQNLLHHVNQAIESRGAGISARLAEEAERHERMSSPRIPDEELAKTISEIHTALIRTVGVKDAVAAATIEGQERTAKYLKNQFLLDIERLGNCKAAVDAMDQEKARRLAEPAVIQDRHTVDVMVSAMTAMVRYHAVSNAISQMEAEKQRRITHDQAGSVHHELIRTMNRKSAVKQMDSELKRRIAKPDKKSADVKQIIADVQRDVVRQFSQKFAALEAEMERERRMTADKFHDVKEELERKVNQRDVDLAMNLELSRQCASWFQGREEKVAEVKCDVQSHLIRSVNQKKALADSDLEKVRRVVENARSDVLNELNRAISRKAVVEMMVNEQKRRCENPCIIAKDVDAALSEAHSKIISKVATKIVTAQAEEERTSRIAADRLSAVLESLCRTVNCRANSKKASAAVFERQELYKNRDPCIARIHKTVMQSITG